MNKIKFTHNYEKLWKQTSGKLVYIRTREAKTVQKNTSLIEYDTTYSDSNGNRLHYELPKKGKLIQLVFMGNLGIPFCTLRKYTPEKFEYYRSKFGENFKIVINENK